MINSHLLEISLVSSFAILLITHFILKNPNPFLSSIKVFVMGLACIILANMAEPYIGLKIPLNEFSIFVSCLMGLPGIGALSILNTLFMWILKK